MSYEKFSRLERELGDLVSDVLSRYLGNNDIHKAFPLEVLQNINKDGSYDYSQANYSDLLHILWHNWDTFSPLFAISRTQLKRTLDRINYGLRPYLAHPHKANRHGYEFGPKDIAAVETGLALIGSAQMTFRSIASGNT